MEAALTTPLYTRERAINEKIKLNKCYRHVKYENVSYNTHPVHDK